MSTHADTMLLHTGELLHAHEPKPIKGFTHWINGLHFIQFDHTALRVLYVVGGLLGCVMIHTGFLFWLESRRVQHHKKKLPGFTVVQALTVGGTIGMLIATAAYLVANQLLPNQLPNRATTETWVFYGVWVLTIIWAFVNAVRFKRLEKPDSRAPQQPVVSTHGCVHSPVCAGLAAQSNQHRWHVRSRP